MSVLVEVQAILKVRMTVLAAGADHACAAARALLPQCRLAAPRSARGSTGGATIAEVVAVDALRETYAGGE